MRTEKEVTDKFHELFDRELRKKKDKYLTCTSMNCRFNMRQHVKGNGKVGFCSNPEIVSKTKRFIFVCNDEQTAKDCRLYHCKHTEESINSEFQEEIRNPALCGQRYPKLAVLLWFLQRQKYPEEANTRLTRLIGMIGAVWKGVTGVVTFKWW